MRTVIRPDEAGTIVGVGLNFLLHAADLQARPTEYPTLFFKGAHTVIGPGEIIPLPAMSSRVTAEAELGLVIGRRMYQVDAADALGYVAGGCCVLDQTAEDILQMDSRMLTVSKNFPGFFSFGPELVPLGELGSAAGGLAGVRVCTHLNGACARSATLADMRFGPAELLVVHQPGHAAGAGGHRQHRHAGRGGPVARRRRGVPHQRHGAAQQPGGGRGRLIRRDKPLPRPPGASALAGGAAVIV